MSAHADNLASDVVGGGKEDGAILNPNLWLPPPLTHDPALFSSTHLNNDLHRPQGIPSFGWQPQAGTSTVDVAVQRETFPPLPTGVHMTYALFGTKVVQVKQIAYQGKQHPMFVFSDISVQSEGKFFLRYRFFDLFSPLPTQGPHPRILAELNGLPFQVFATKRFPGLHRSTDLTKALLAQGVSVHVRQSMRKRASSGDDVDVEED